MYLPVGLALGNSLAFVVAFLAAGERDLQNTADAAALAGVAELPNDPAAAGTRAIEWAANNGVASGEIKSIEARTTGFPNDTLFVEVENTFGWIFGRVLGQTTSAVSAKAAAQVGSLVGGNDLMPWAIVMGDSACLDASGVQIPGADCSVKVGARNGIGGWRGALDLDANGGGSKEYESNIIDGEAETVYCSRGQTEPECETTEVNVLTGNKAGGTAHGIDTRLLAEATPGCDINGNDIDDFGEVFTANTNGSGANFSVTCPGSPRLIIIPIVTLNGDPVKTVTIEGWALAYLSGYRCVGDNTCNGKGHWEVQVTVVDAVFSQAAGFLGAFDPLSAVTVRRLIE